MKKVLGLLLLLLILDISCKELDKFTMFDIGYETSFDLPGIPQLHVPVEIWVPPVPTYSDSIFEAYNTRAGMIEEVILKELRLVISSGETNDFRFLQSISFFLAGDHIPEKEVAWLREIPDDIHDTLILNTTPSNLREYITEDTLRVKVMVLTDSAKTDKSLINILTIFQVDAKILGI